MSKSYALGWAFSLVILAFGCARADSSGAPSPRGRDVTEIKIEQVEPEDQEIIEEWVRKTDEGDLLGVGSSRSSDPDWPWQVFVSVMEFIREDPLESELADAVTAALARVPGVAEAHQVDREAWAIKGQASGYALTSAAARVVDQFAPRTRVVLDQLDSGK
ncbi:MAG: hypothetical protein JNN13_16465 [Planctomycetes bacterium]|nr:hypothetical protein [Planctomycetota bacterium]